VLPFARANKWPITGLELPDEINKPHASKDIFEISIALQ
jgi:hypothetical protein